MKLSQVERCLVAVALKSPPFKAGSLADEVGKILEIGNSKHADDQTRASEHIQHAVNHFRTAGDDTETGLSHRAHGIARLLLAVMVMCRGGEK